MRLGYWLEHFFGAFALTYMGLLGGALVWPEWTPENYLFLFTIAAVAMGSAWATLRTSR